MKDAEVAGTSELMEGFTGTMAPGLPFERALTAALRSAMMKRPHPYSWAPSVPVGSGRGRSGRSSRRRPQRGPDS